MVEDHQEQVGIEAGERGHEDEVSEEMDRGRAEKRELPHDAGRLTLPVMACPS